MYWRMTADSDHSCIGLAHSLATPDINFLANTIAGLGICAHGLHPVADSGSMRIFSIICCRASRVIATLASALVAIVLASTDVHAQSGVYKHRSADGSVIFSDAPIRNGQVVRSSYKGTFRTPTVANPCKGLSVADLDAKGRALNRHFAKASVQSGVDASLLKAVARAESCFDPSAISRAGARGLMQLMPPTAGEMGVADIHDLEQNLQGGARYLAAMLARYSNDLELALAAYNAGPGNVDKYNGVPPFSETQRYIVSVKAFRDRYQRMQSTTATLTSGQ